MKHKFLKHIILIAIIAILFFGCKPEIIYYEIPEELLAYVDYPFGTYWKYQDSISGDTTEVKLTKRIFTEKFLWNDESNIYIDELKQKFSKDSIEYYANSFFGSTDLETYFYSGVEFTFSLNCINLSFSNKACYEPRPILVDTIVIENKTYSDILIIISNNKTKKIYFEKNIGTIRIEEYENGTYINGVLIQENLLRVENLIETNANQKNNI